MKNMRIYRVMIIVCVGLSLLISGCTWKHKAEESARVTEVSLTCIAVLPVSIEQEHGMDQRLDDKKNLAEGVSALDRLLKKKLSDFEGIRFVAGEQFSEFTHGGTTGFLSMVREVAAQTNCNGILAMTLHRYSERVGGPYTAKMPASVSFSWRLIEAGSGTILCHGRYDETQKSVMENLYNLAIASRRGFAWVTATRLLEDGLKEQFATCPYL